MSAGDAGTDYPPHSLRDYALLADGYRGALIGPRGDVSFLCAPTWDSPPVFSHLLGGGGLYAITPLDTFVWGGYYEPGSLIWRSRWMTTQCLIECREALAQPADPHRLVLLRRIQASARQPARVEVRLDVAADFGRAAKAKAHRDDEGRWTITSGELRCRWTGAGDARVTRAGPLTLHLEVPAGAHHDLVLEVGDGELPEPVDPDSAWASTAAHWRDIVPGFEQSAAPRDSRHAYAVLRGMTVPGGGMVAAATLSLPERAEAGRNYDYRYVWLRDQAYAGIAAGVDEPLPLLDEATAFTTARVLEHAGKLAPAYRIDGSLPPKEEVIDLPGYPGGQVKVGNWVRGQFQLDGCGEMLQLYATAGRHDHLGSDDHRALTAVVDTIDKRWTAPDAGVWELDNAWWTQSRLACVAGLRAVAGAVGAVDATRVLGLADAIMAETSKRCLGHDGVWQQASDRPGVDASLLLATVRGALAADDPRSLATLQAVTDHLVEDGYVYRYAVDGQPLGEAEGAFLMCGFAMSLAQSCAGNTVEAYRWFERQRAACGPAGLLSEEFDVRQRQLRGNLPQGFVHALLLECSLRLGRSGPPSQGGFGSR